MIKSSVEQIVAFGKVVRPALGIAFAPDQSSEQLGIHGEGSRGQGGDGLSLLGSPSAEGEGGLPRPGERGRKRRVLLLHGASPADLTHTLLPLLLPASIPRHPGPERKGGRPGFQGRSVRDHA